MRVAQRPPHVAVAALGARRQRAALRDGTGVAARAHQEGREPRQRGARGVRRDALEGLRAAQGGADVGGVDVGRAGGRRGGHDAREREPAALKQPQRALKAAGVRRVRECDIDAVVVQRRFAHVEACPVGGDKGGHGVARAAGADEGVCAAEAGKEHAGADGRGDDGRKQRVGAAPKGRGAQGARPVQRALGGRLRVERREPPRVGAHLLRARARPRLGEVCARERLEQRDLCDDEGRARAVAVDKRNVRGVHAAAVHPQERVALEAGHALLLQRAPGPQPVAAGGVHVLHEKIARRRGDTGARVQLGLRYGA